MGNQIQIDLRIMLSCYHAMGLLSPGKLAIGILVRYMNYKLINGAQLEAPSLR